MTNSDSEEDSGRPLRYYVIWVAAWLLSLPFRFFLFYTKNWLWYGESEHLDGVKR